MPPREPESARRLREALGAGPGRRANPPRRRAPAEVPRAQWSDAPVRLPEDLRGVATILSEARRLGASDARVLWGLAAVMEAVAERMERDRALDREAPELAVQALRRWCRGETRWIEVSDAQRALLEPAQVGPWWKADASPHPGYKAAYDGMSGAAEIAVGRALDPDWLAHLLRSSAAYLGDDDQPGAGEARVEAILLRALAEPMEGRRSNPRAPKGPEGCDPGAPPRPVADHWPGAADIARRAMPLLRVYGRDWEPGALGRLREACRALGLPLLGAGASRGAFALPDEGAVVKVEFAPHPELEDSPNFEETLRWKYATEAEARWLAPVLAADHDADWLVMARTEPLGSWPKGAKAALRRLTDDDLNLHNNVGRWCGRLVLHDYAV